MSRSLAIPYSHQTQRKLSLVDDLMEEPMIHIKPSTELTADEYDISINQVTVHLFSSGTEYDDFNINTFKEVLANYEYLLPKENVHDLRTENLPEVLTQIRAKSSGINGLILLFSGLYEYDGELLAFNGEQRISFSVQKIWGQFTSYVCPELKNKPKIFIFHLSEKLKTTLQTDGKRTYMKYDTPGEADIGIIYFKTISDDVQERIEFIPNLCENIQKYGKREDIFTLATITEFDENKSNRLIMSTMIKKFYIVESKHRGNYLEISECTQTLVETLGEIRDKVEEISKPRKKRSIMSSFRNYIMNSDNQAIIRRMTSNRRDAPGNGASTSQTN